MPSGLWAGLSSGESGRANYLPSDDILETVFYESVLSFIIRLNGIFLAERGGLRNCHRCTRPARVTMNFNKERGFRVPKSWNATLLAKPRELLKNACRLIGV